ncbi:MAG TPA: ABC transporter permease [Verrucomicrobiae bacterium]|jgi:predicted permease|nr:ABC transporter permease [Verrucomicrobiae bacterium]
MIHWLRHSFERLRSVFQRAELDQELDTELAAHLELAIEENLQRGMSSEEARRRALISLGGTEQAKEHHREARGLPAVDTFFQDVRYAARGTVKTPGFTVAAVLTLGLGIAANATMFSMVSGFLLRRPPGRDPERVVVVTSVSPAQGFQPDANAVSAPNYLAWRAAGNIFENMAATDNYRAVSLTSQGQTTSVPSEAVTPEYFTVLGVSPHLGRIFAEGDDQPGRDHVVILSHELWDREFGSDSSLIGRSVRLNREDYTVIGVMPANFQMLGFTPQLWTPLVVTAADQTAAARRNRSLYVFARLKPGVTLAQARAEMKTLGRRAEEDFPDTEKGWGVAARTLPDFLVYLFGIRSALVVMMTVVGFVLLIACANVAGLLLARAGTRGKELAIRMSLGASRLRIVRQLLTEGLIIALLGGGAGLLLAYWGVKFVRANMAFNEAASAVPLSLDWNVLLFALGVSMLSAILCSLAPALTASRTDINSNLKDQSRAASAGRSQSRLRTVLVTAEIAMALFLLIGTGLLIRGVFLIQHQALGFQAEHQITAGVTLDSARYKDPVQQTLFVKDLLPRLRQLPGVGAVAAVSELPATGAGHVTLLIQGQPELPADQRPRTVDVIVTDDYFRTAGIPLLRGRAFTGLDNAAAPRVAVVNQEFVRRYLKDQDPLGKQVRLDLSGSTPAWSEIVGVVGNVKFYSETTRYDPELYEPFLQRPVSSFSLMVRTSSDPNGLASDLRKTVAQADLELPLAHVMSMSTIIERQKGGDLLFMQMLAALALLALTLAAIGIYGLISYSVGQRTHEIAIRMALGATGGDVRRMVLSQGVKMVSIGAAIGLVVALPLPRVFAAVFSDIDTSDPRTYVIVLVAIFLVALLATYVPARRASALDPIRALHSE